MDVAAVRARSRVTIGSRAKWARYAGRVDRAEAAVVYRLLRDHGPLDHYEIGLRAFPFDVDNPPPVPRGLYGPDRNGVVWAPPTGAEWEFWEWYSIDLGFQSIYWLRAHGVTVLCEPGSSVDESSTFRIVESPSSHT